MVAALIWSSESLDDIDAIAQFISRDSPHHAQRVVEGLFELGDVQVRERFLYSYRLIYEARPDRIAVLAVLHGRRLLESIGERFEG
ncbi:type II toxin-antitoxin system RelE/ParE family toxin [Metallibacterium scheffleri]|uniref:Plasmid stabilization protein n=1 Tax=Metallibacterium scheffleri TaxID=993689 RepID=A0A4S3KI14_9GAMM|nr:type II toxin-antitoxin system RelE/ParE family toxin [Metallibacterium scheffleri]THD08316.1 hypothetical protein B1806_13090 [Metallibacterium scheffleri]